MEKVTKKDIIDDAWALKVSLTEEEVDYCVGEVNNFFASRPDFNCDDISESCVELTPLRYVNSEVVNVFSAREETLVSAEEVLSNTLDREGNYVKVPKVLK